MTEVKVREQERDPEAVAMDVAMHYMNHAEESAKGRFMMHLQHKYFPKGIFVMRLTAPTTFSPPGSDFEAPRATAHAPPSPPPALPEDPKK